MSTGGEYVYDALRSVDIEHAIGIPGRGTLPLDQTIRHSDAMEYVLARHETSVPYIAWGYYASSGKPAATITVPGPGDTNASNGLRNATIDRVPIIHIASDVPPEARGTGFIHEIDPGTYDTVVKANVDITSPHDVPAAVDRAIERALRPPLGPARIGIPYLDVELDAEEPSIRPDRGRSVDESGYERAIETISNARRPVVYLGAGAKRPPTGMPPLERLVEALDAPFITSYNGKGAMPETDDRWAGTTGAQFPAGAVEMLASADVVLALGTDFGGPTTRGGSFPMGETLVHVSSDPAVFGRQYEADVTIVDDVPRASERLLEGVEDRGPSRTWNGRDIGRRIHAEYREFVEGAGLFEDREPAPTPAVVREVDARLPEDAIVVADIAEFRTWAMQLVRARSPTSFIATGAWTSMGVGLPGAVGASLANPERPVVCLSGDGGLMQGIEELHTAAEYDLDVTVVVCNNSHLAMISTTPGLSREDRFGWDSPNYVKIAEGFGLEAMATRTPSETGDALDEAIANDGPTLLDVGVDPDEPSSMDAWEYDSSLDFELLA